MGMLHSLDKKKVPVKINGVEVIPEIKEPKRISDVMFGMRNEPAF
jgi:hypothetical protein